MAFGERIVLAISLANREWLLIPNALELLKQLLKSREFWVPAQWQLLSDFFNQPLVSRAGHLLSGALCAECFETDCLLDTGLIALTELLHSSNSRDSIHRPAAYRSGNSLSFFNTIIIILLENLLLFIFIICFRSGERAGRFECHWVLRKPPGTTNATEGTGPDCWDCELKIRNQSSKSKPLKFESKLSNARSAQRNASYLSRNWFICLCLLSANCFVHFVRPFEFLIKNFWFILVIFWMASSSVTWASKRQNVRRDCSAKCYFSCCLVNKRWKVRVSREFGRFSSDRYRSLQFI